jgi:hypothetical protein
MGRRPSDRVKLLEAFSEFFAESKRQMFSSEEFVAYLRRDPTSIWADFYRGGTITQRQVAFLLEDGFDIYPTVIHPSKRSTHSPRGYNLEQFADAFERYLPAQAHIRTQDPQPKKPMMKIRSKAAKPRRRAKWRK